MRVSPPAENVSIVPDTLCLLLQDLKCVGLCQAFKSLVATSSLSRTLDCQHLVGSNLLFLFPMLYTTLLSMARFINH